MKFPLRHRTFIWQGCNSPIIYDTFAKYRKCTEVYTAQFAGGRSVDRLTVAG